jgi:hypothetical protein
MMVERDITYPNGDAEITYFTTGKGALPINEREVFEDEII